jgi:hypothetical protein
LSNVFKERIGWDYSSSPARRVSAGYALTEMARQNTAKPFGTERPVVGDNSDNRRVENESAKGTADKYRISNKECRMTKFLSFDIHNSLFNILRFSFLSP